MSLSSRIPISGTKSSIPLLGFGVYKLRQAHCLNACLVALKAGYRHIDCAQLYKNEALVREAVGQSNVNRSDIFITSKFNPGTAADPYRSILGSVENLDGPNGYVDLFLLHVPGRSRAKRHAAWAALERLYDEGVVKAIGVSNFHIDHLEEMREYARQWPPHINQIEVHPWCQQRKLVTYCQENSIIIEAYSPLAVGTRLEDPTLEDLAHKHSKPAAQILLRWSLQKGFIPLPKSQTPSRITENSHVFDFELTADDMANLDALDEGIKGALFPFNAS